MPKIVTLKDNNDDIVYPITPIDAVFTDTSVTLENMIDAKADTDLTNVVNGSVTTNKIANSAVTSDKIDWATLGTTGLAFSAGNTYTISDPNVSIVGSGFITSSQTRVWVCLPLGRPVIGTPTITINALYGAIRTTGGSLISGGGRDWTSNITNSYLKGSDLILNINVSGLSNIPTNNTPVSFSVESNTGIQFTLS